MQREAACHTLTARLAYLFARMSMLNRTYTEPSDVLRSLVDDYGQHLLLGEQKDIGEFNLNFLERIEEGLGERTEAKRLVEQLLAPDLVPDRRDFFARKSSIVDDTPENGATPDAAETPCVVRPSEEAKQADETRNTIFNMFFGKMNQILKVDNQQRVKIFSNKTEKMGPVMLDVH